MSELNFNRYYVFLDRQYYPGAAMSSCEKRLNDKKEAIKLAKDLLEENNHVGFMVSVWDVVNEEYIYKDNNIE